MISCKMADDEFVTDVAEKEVIHLDNVKVTVKDTAIIETEMTSVAHNASEDSECETPEDDNGVDEEDLEDTDRSFGSRRSSPLEEGELLSDGESVIIEDERVDGDGEEESEPTKDRKLDDDEDRRNPQYIPKKGTFYEHDDRTLLEDGEDGEGVVNSGGENDEIGPGGDVASTANGSNLNIKEAGDDTKQKRTPGGTSGKAKAGGKVWVDKGNDKWQHDLYIEDDQKPKSTQELIDTYGYDIRNEEAPPKARRRRRYGRGPNKYTRNWEDEDAYKPSAVIVVGGRGTRGRGRGVGRSGTRGRGRPVRDGSGDEIAGRGRPLSLNAENDLEDPTTKLANSTPHTLDEFPKLSDQTPRRSHTKAPNSHLKHTNGSSSTVSGVSVSVRKISKNFNSRMKLIGRNPNHISSKRHSDEHNSSGTTQLGQSKQANSKESVQLNRINPVELPRNYRGRGKHMSNEPTERFTYDTAINEKGDAERLVNKYTSLMEFTSSSRGRGRLPPPAFSSNNRKFSSATVSSSDANTIQSVTQKLNQFEISPSAATYSASNGEDIGGRPPSKDGLQSERRVQEVPPRMQETSSTNVRKSKRYSAQRQRSLPETTYSPPPAPQQPSGASGAPQQTKTPGQQQQAQHQIQFFSPPPAQTISVPDYPPPPVFNESVGVGVAGPPPMVAFIPPGPPPPPGTAPPFPPPPIINYVPTPAPYHAMPLQPPTVQQAELFQGQNGITYYSTQTQVALQRPTPPRRVKLAIPIVPPPADQAPRGRGRSTEQDAKA